MVRGEEQLVTEKIDLWKVQRCTFECAIDDGGA
jgi:hypothetical protein